MATVLERLQERRNSTLDEWEVLVVASEGRRAELAARLAPLSFHERRTAARAEERAHRVAEEALKAASERYELEVAEIDLRLAEEKAAGCERPLSRAALARTAAHEAGHAIFARLAGATVRSLVIRGDGGGNTRYAHAGDPHPFDVAAIALAGMEAERALEVYVPATWERSADDLEAARQAAEGQADDFLQRAGAAVRERLRLDAGDVALVARALYHRRFLSGRDVEELFAAEAARCGRRR